MRKTELEGIIKRHADGFGFFIPDQTDFPDVYIPKHYMQGVMTSDRVKIEAMPERGGERFRGKILEVLSRGQSQAVGRFHRSEETGGGFVVDQGHGWGQDILIDEEFCENAEPGDMVVVYIVGYPDGSQPLTGQVKAVIGDVDDPLNDIKRVVHSNGIPYEFSRRTLKEAEQIPQEVSTQDFRGRRNLTDLDFITIDGKTAKDFDDAIYVKVDNRGFHLYVAIADVSHYVKPGTGLDEDAYERGNSSYFPNFVIPMLPESLSNGICSLRPKVYRLAVVAQMQIDFSGEVTACEFYESVICSKSRVTYGEAQEVIEGADVEEHRHVTHVIKKAAQLAEILQVKRMKEGSLNLEIPETELMIDESGEPIDIIKSERLFAHKLIEEMMLVANVEVAKFLAKQDFASLYRIHEEPDPASVEILARYLKTFGGKKKIAGGKLQKKISRALREFHGQPEAQVLNILALRSLSQAKYSPGNVGHFGLGFEFYSHFTSPIRRYPDLIIHRLLKAAIIPSKGYKPLQEDDLATASTMLSSCEQRSVKAERQLISIKKARYMSKHLGDEFDGVISSVTKFGVFVLLRAYDIDGLVKLDELGKEHFFFDENNLRLIGKRSGFTYSIGQQLKIQVAKSDTETGMIDFVLPKGEGGWNEELDFKFKEKPTGQKKFKKQGEKNAVFAKASHRQDSKKRRKAAKNRKRVRKARVSGRRGKGKTS